MGKYFGTDGFRGEANVDLTFEHAVKIGRYLGWYYGTRLGKKAKIVIGKDTRRSSYMFEYALCTGLDGIRSRCLHHARNDDTVGGLYHESRRIRLRHHDLGIAQPVL